MSLLSSYKDSVLELKVHPTLPLICACTMDGSIEIFTFEHSAEAQSLVVCEGEAAEYSWCEWHPTKPLLVAGFPPVVENSNDNGMMEDRDGADMSLVEGSGCQIWNALTGQCLATIKTKSSSQMISGFLATDQSLNSNKKSSCLALSCTIYSIDSL